MKIKLSVDNNYLNLFNVETVLHRNGKKKIESEWKKAERFMKNSHFAGKKNLTVSLSVNNNVIFDKTKVKHKEDSYHNVFQLLENFLLDKLFFFNKLERNERTYQLEQEYIQNQLNLITIKKLNQEMRKS